MARYEAIFDRKVGDKYGNDCFVAIAPSNDMVEQGCAINKASWRGTKPSSIEKSATRMAMIASPPYGGSQ